MTQDTYELREARSEISRHHELIVSLRDGLRWALKRTDVVPGSLDADHKAKLEQLLNRQVS